jgi:uncharacterized membrane protein YjgN (DUF898 family)
MLQVASPVNLGVFGLWWKRLILSIITLGIYLFWVGSRIYRWKWEHTSWARQNL